MIASTKEKDIIWARVRKEAIFGQFEVKHILFHAENEKPDKEVCCRSKIKIRNYFFFKC